jgi:hypothetical protein
MRARLAVFVLPFVLVACKKERPAPAPASSAPAAPAVTSRAAAPGESLAILKDFEGQISWVAKGKLAGTAKAAEGPATLNLKLLVKDAAFRLDVPPGLGGPTGPGNAYLLGKPQEKKFYTIVEAQKQAILMDSDWLVAQAHADSLGGKHAGPGAGADAPTVKKTGTIDKVAGYACEIWNVTHGATKLDFCIAASDTAWFQWQPAKMPEKYAWATELTDGKHFPLRFVMYDKSGAEEGRVELSGIEKKKLEAALFEVPAGFQVVDLKVMLSGLMQNLVGKHGRPGMAGLEGLPGMPSALPSALLRPPAGKAPTPAGSAKKP